MRAMGSPCRGYATISTSRSSSAADRRPLKRVAPLSYEAWIDYTSDSTTTIGVHTSPDLGNTWNSAFTRALSASSISHVLFPIYETAQSPLFEIRVNDGSVPKISRMSPSMSPAVRKRQ